MKKLFLSVLLALTTVSSHAANLYSSNLGNGISTLGSVSGIASGTVRFGTFPAAFDFAANAENYAALDAAFTEVHSFSGALTVDAVAGFYQTAHTYDANGTVEGVSYASGIAGQKVYIWILNTTNPAVATQQAIFSTSQVWVAADAVIQDTIVSPDTGVPGLAVHLGSLANGNNIGAGAPSHTTSGASIEVSGVVVARTTPASAGPVLEETVVTLTATVAEGTFPLFYQWRVNGTPIPGATSSTYTIRPAFLGDAGNYDVLVSNIVSTNVASNVYNLEVVTTTPTILTEPQPSIVAVGGTLNLAVEAVGQGTVSYQWKKGAEIPGATAPALVLPNMTLANSGAYSVTVTNALGKVTSANAEVAVVDQTPETIVGAVGSTATLKAIVSGKNVTYQWYRGMTKIYNTAKFAGATTPTLTVKKLTVFDSADYYCVVTLGGASLNSGIRTLKVFGAEPVIVEPVTMPNGRIGATYTFQIPVDPDALRAPTSYFATNVPKGLKLDSKTGVISGRPLVTGQFNITLTASNSLGSDTSGPYLVNITGFPDGLGGTYIGAVDRQPAVLGGNLGGRFEMTVSTTGAVSGKLYLGAQTLSTTGVIEVPANFPTDPATAMFTVVRTGGLTPLILGFELQGDNYLVNGYISDSINDITFDGWRQIWSKTTTPAGDYLGLYNAVVGLDIGSPLVGDDSIPQGAGYLTFTVAADGKLSIKGKTADGEGITGSTVMGPAGEVFVFTPLYKTKEKGSLVGEFDVEIESAATTSDNMLLGAATQSRPADPAAAQKTYRAGFEPYDLIITGGRYDAPAAGFVALGLAENGTAELDFSEGGLTSDPSVTVTIQAASKVVVNGANPGTVKLTIAAATGIFTGSFVQSGKTAKFEGIIAPDNGDLTGLGSFLLSDAANTRVLSGLVELAVP